VLAGALIGSVAALGATFGSYLLRKNVVNKTKIFDPVIGSIEDALVIGAGISKKSALRTNKKTLVVSLAWQISWPIINFRYKLLKILLISEVIVLE
jgi:hypothetical protein